MKFSIVILSSSDYHIFSPICLYFIKKNFNNDLNLDIIYINNKYELEDKDVKNIIIKNGDKFTNRLYYALEKIDSDYIFLVLEDFWFIDKFLNKEGFDKIVNICEKYDLCQLKLHPTAYGCLGVPSIDNIQNDILFQDNQLIISWAGGCDYPVSHYPTLFKKSYLLNNLKDSYNSNHYSTSDHEVFNFQYVNNVKKFHNDSKELKIAYMNYFEPHININFVLNSVYNGKLTEYGLNILKEYSDNNEFKNLLEIIYNTNFI